MLSLEQERRALNTGWRQIEHMGKQENKAQDYIRLMKRRERRAPKSDAQEM